MACVLGIAQENLIEPPRERRLHDDMPDGELVI